VQALANAVMQVVQRVRRTQARGLKRRSVDLTTVAVLEAIVARGPVHPSALAAELAVPPSSVTRQVQAIEQAGHVAVVGDPADRRACLIEATAAGREELQRLHAISLEAFAPLITDWDVEEIRTLTALLTRFAAGLPSDQPHWRARRSWRQGGSVPRQRAEEERE